ncbi:MAG: peptidylprolyl isomerase [Bacteroidota bacterium]|nr:peptidylprolyl isomerase [Bacteroidota bacterium]
MRKVFFIVLILVNISVFAQDDTLIVDQIVARVGDEIILQSDVESQYYQWLANGNAASRQAKCNVLEDILIQKLLINQAKIDSLFVSSSELEMQVDARIEIFVQQFGGITELENYLNKSIYDIKKDLKKVIHDQLLAQKEQGQITMDITITPSEVAEYYKTLHQDSIPLVDVSYEIRQITISPILLESEQQITIDRINDIRQKIVSGTRKFESLAIMYSNDDISAKNGGELGFTGRAELDPEFAAAAFALQKDSISDVVVTKYGRHIIQLIERRGERINVRHILIRRIIPSVAIQRTIVYADSIRNYIINDSISFNDAALLHSYDIDTKNNGGYLFNNTTGGTKFSINQLPHNIKYDVINLKENEISAPISTLDKIENQVVKIYKIEKKTPQHVANLKDDYQLFYEMALQNKKTEIFLDWVEQQQKQVYISIITDFQTCNFKFKHWLKK